MRLRWLPLVLALLPLQGCGVLALIHDKMLGPVSPIGEIHSVVVSNDYIVTDRGIVGVSDGKGVAMFRPIPPGFPRRYAEPASLRKGMRGIHAFLRGISFVVWGETSKGKRLDPNAVGRLFKGLTAEEVLKLLGTPNMWLRREGGSLMAYRAELGTFLSVTLGVPPFFDNAVPIPGIGNLRIRWDYNIVKPYKTILIFDGENRLLSWFQNDPDKTMQRLEEAEEEADAAEEEAEEAREKAEEAREEGEPR